MISILFLLGRDMADWLSELSVFLQPFLKKLGYKNRRQMCPLYVCRLIGPGNRKSIEPMAEQLAPGRYDPCTISFPTIFGMQRLLGLNSRDRRTGSLAHRMLSGDRRHRSTEGGRPLGRRRAAIRFDVGQESKLPDAGFDDACSKRGACSGWLAFVFSRGRIRQSSARLLRLRLS
jgi:hypothetical protein